MDGEDAEVTSEVYQAYAQADRKERYGYEREDGLLLSLERIEEDGMHLSCLTDQHVESAEDTAIREILVGRMIGVLPQLLPEERELINQLFFQGISARELARSSGVYHRTVIYHRDKVLNKLRRLMDV